jgi:antitoxin ParD1/3/4
MTRKLLRVAKVAAAWDQDRATLRRLVLEGAASPPAEPTDDAYFDGLRARIRHRRTDR